MDKNKLKVLQDIGYEVHKVCGLCKHGQFGYSALFGGCTIRTYNHAKHVAENKNLSISRYGSCPSFEYNEQYDVMLHGFREFLK